MLQHNYVFLSGLPRTGSTLLTTLLNQNPLIHAEGISNLCQFMFDLHTSCSKKNTALLANNREKTKHDLVSSLPDIYYQNVDKKIVIDKNRAWTTPENLNIIKEYITPNPKIIVMTRPLHEIIKSFVRVYTENNRPENIEKDLLAIMSEPVMRSAAGVKWAKENNNGEFLFLTYDQLVFETKNTLQTIYEFCNWESFEHNLKNVVTENPENDLVYNLKGLHHIRPTISKVQNDISLSEQSMRICEIMDSPFLKLEEFLCEHT